MNNRKMYLAGPFFNEEQRATMGRLEWMLKQRGIEFFSPRLECFCPPDATQEQRKESYQANIDHINVAPSVLARIDDFDPGTMYEIGWAQAKEIPVFAFTTVEGRGLNLMLAAGGVRIIQGWDALDRFLDGETGVAIQWTKSII